jgi:hypothetical protein
MEVPFVHPVLVPLALNLTGAVFAGNVHRIIFNCWQNKTAKLAKKTGGLIRRSSN